LSDLNNYDSIEKLYIKRYYPAYKIIRTLVLYGGTEEKITEIQVGFWLNQNGKMILGIRAPRLFVDSIRNLLDFWKEE